MMTKYYIDCEFDGHGGRLLSLALVRETGQALYLVSPNIEVKSVWVRENVIPILFDNNIPVRAEICREPEWTSKMDQFFRSFEEQWVEFIADWPADVRYVAGLLETIPGRMIPLDRVTFDVIRVDSYPTTLENARQHNAYWDAAALKHYIEGRNNARDPAGPGV